MTGSASCWDPSAVGDAEEEFDLEEVEFGKSRADLNPEPSIVSTAAAFPPA